MLAKMHQHLEAGLGSTLKGLKMEILGPFFCTWVCMRPPWPSWFASVPFYKCAQPMSLPASLLLPLPAHPQFL